MVRIWVTYMRCLRALHVWSSVRITVWSDFSLDRGMYLKCFLCCLERMSSRYRRLLLRIRSQQHTNYVQSVLCEFIWRRLVISDWQSSCLYVSVAIPKDCQCQNIQCDNCHIGLWKQSRWRMLLRMRPVHGEYTPIPQK